MSTHRLLLSVPRRELVRLPATDFLWRTPPASSSFRTDIGPRLHEAADAPRPNVEFARLAVLAYLVDRTTPRPHGSWLREFDLQVPVWDPAPWLGAAAALQRLLGFLTSDWWRLTFVRARTPRAQTSRPAPAGPAAALFSGGADSLAGALIFEHQTGTSPILVSHRDWPLVTGVQNALTAKLTEFWGNPPPAFSATIGRSRNQLGSGEAFGQEETSRARSLLFVALGLAIAAQSGVPLRISENGFAALNPPMGGERRGALSTRTTHPWYLAELQRILDRVGAHSAIENPFAYHTKAEMFAQVAANHGRDVASKLLSASHSCARGDNRFAAVEGALHCGVCFGCLVRRAAFVGSGLTDHTVYVIDDLDTPVGARGSWYSEKRRRDLQAVRYAAYRGVDPVEVTRNLPTSFDPAGAIDVAARGLEELAELVL